MPMDLGAAIDIFSIQAWHTAALMFSLAMNTLIILRADHSPLLSRYLAVQGCLVLWIIAKLLKTISPEYDLRWVVIVIQYVGVAGMGAAFFVFAFHFAYGRDPSRPVMMFLTLGALAHFLLVATNGMHQLYYATFDFFSDSFGPVFYITAAFQYSLIFSGMFILLRKVVMNPRGHKQERLLVAATLVPVSANILYIAGIIEPMFDLTPIAMTLSLILFAIAAFRHAFLGVLPLARRIVCESLDDKVLFLDKKGVALLPGTAFPGPGFGTKFRSLSPGGSITTGGRQYRLLQRIRKRKWVLEQWADITSMRKIEEKKRDAVQRLHLLDGDIAEVNAVLLEAARSDALRLARQNLHDALGHSLTQAILLLHSARTVVSRDPISAREWVGRARETCRYGLEEISGHTTGLNDGEGLLTTDIYHLVEAFTNLPIKLKVTAVGQERPLSSASRKSLYRCCQESITNAVKHGAASAVDVVIRYSPDELLCLVVDDGDGCENPRAGMGLTGMGERLASAGGTLRYASENNGGFLVSMSLPIPV